MINPEATKQGRKSALATICASMLTCALALPAIAVPTTRVVPSSNHLSDAGIAGSARQVQDYDQDAPLAGVQYVADDDEGESHRAWAEPEHEHLKNERREMRENLRDSREDAREQAERMENPVEEERAEHARHEMREHQAEREHEHDDD